MGFRDDFLRDGQTYAQWRIEATLESTRETLDRRLGQIHKDLSERVVDRLDGATQAVGALQSELSYQSRLIREQIARSNHEVVDTIRRMTYYVGTWLVEVRWAIDRLTATTQRILETLLESLDNLSRQYFEQGLRCYEAGEYVLARDRFYQALKSNITNYFAHQYLGFIAVHESEPDEAMRGFELAVKFANTDRQRAEALSHLALCHAAMGRWADGAAIWEMAADTDPTWAAASYDLARAYAVLGDRDRFTRALRHAIERDWALFALAATEPGFRTCREEVAALLRTLRDEQWQLAAQMASQTLGALSILEGVSLQIDAAECRDLHDEVSQRAAAADDRNIYVAMELQRRSKVAAQAALAEAKRISDGSIRQDHERIQKSEALPASRKNLAQESGRIAGLIAGVCATIATLNFAGDMDTSPGYRVLTAIVGGFMAFILAPWPVIGAAYLLAEALRGRWEREAAAQVAAVHARMHAKEEALASLAREFSRIARLVDTIDCLRPERGGPATDRAPSSPPGRALASDGVGGRSRPIQRS